MSRKTECQETFHSSQKYISQNTAVSTLKIYPISSFFEETIPWKMCVRVDIWTYIYMNGS